jgi:hypothetical protein
MSVYRRHTVDRDTIQHGVDPTPAGLQPSRLRCGIPDTSDRRTGYRPEPT